MEPSNKGYHPLSKSFHWLIAFLVAAEVIIALIMPEIRRQGTPPTFLLNLHMSFGAAIMIIMVARLLWRFVSPPPALPSDTTKLMAAAAHGTHYLLYALLFITPIAGWMWANYMGWQPTLFGIISLPSIVNAGSQAGRFASEIHGFLAWSIVTLVGLHTLAALYHWYAKKDDILQRMLPTHPLTTKALGYFENIRN